MEDDLLLSIILDDKFDIEHGLNNQDQHFGAETPKSKPSREIHCRRQDLHMNQQFVIAVVTVIATEKYSVFLPASCLLNLL